MVSSIGEDSDGLTLSQESINTVTTTVVGSVGTGETSITLVDVKAVDIAPTAADGGTYYFSYNSGAQTSSTGKVLSSSKPLILVADYGERLNFTIYISRSTGSGTLLVDEYTL